MLQIESFDSGSNYKFNQSVKKAGVPKSAFDLSHSVITTINNAGKLNVLSWFPTLGTDDFSISAQSLLRVMPQTVPLYSRQRHYIYCFHNNLADLWDSFQTFIRNGYNGTTDKLIPTFNDDNLLPNEIVEGVEVENEIQPGSVGDMLGLPIGMTRTQIVGAGVSCLSAMMFYRICRDYFINKNFYANNRALLPDDDSRFRLNDDGNINSFEDLGYQAVFDIFNANASGVVQDDVNKTITLGNMYHEYPKDFFTSALLSPQRGPEQFLSFNSLIDFSDAFGSVNESYYQTTPIHLAYVRENEGHNTEGLFGGAYSSDNFFINNTASKNLLGFLNKAKISGIQISLNDIRNLSINQTILESLAKTDGSFDEFGLAMFGESPRSAEDFKSVFVGGTYKDIAFTEVLQTSATSETSALGQYGGHGISGQSDYLGNFHVSGEHGMLMFMSCVMPDVYYCQGLDRKFTKLTQAEMFLPERCKLGAQPILNQEIYYAGNNGTSEGDDKYLFGYQNYGDEFRYIQNRISGKIADPSNLSFFPFTQARYFEELPTLGKSFVTADDVRKDYLASGELEDAYSCEYHFTIKAVRPLPYNQVPSKIV